MKTTVTQDILTLYDYQMAIHSQDACNLSGLVRSLAQVLDKIHNEARQNGKGSDWINAHPIVRLYVEQLAHLTAAGPGNPVTYQTAWHSVEKKIEELRAAQPHP